MPGNTPISVPSVHPISANHRFCRVPAAANPVAKLAKTSMAYSPHHAGNGCPSA